MVVAAAVGGLVGARLLFIIESWSDFLRSPLDFLFTGAGFTWHGGLIGGVLAVSGVVAKHKIPWKKAADIAAPALAMGTISGDSDGHVAGDGDWGHGDRRRMGCRLHERNHWLGESANGSSVCAGCSRSSDADL